MTLYEIVHPDFAKLIVPNARLDCLHDGCRRAEGPAWFGGGRYLLWSDIPNNQILRWDETDGSVSVFRSPSVYSNGNTVDREGRLVSCESDGAIWFTDPSYGIDNDYEGNKAESEIGACNVYRVDPVTRSVETIITDMVRPNGLSFSPDETLLYVADTGGTHKPGHPAELRAYSVSLDGKSVANGRRFASSTSGFFDGFRLDSEGRIWSSAADGLHCFAPDGTLLGKILVPEVVANCAFGSRKQNILFICATSSLYAVPLLVRAAGP